MNKHQWVKLLAGTAAVVGLAFWVNAGREPQMSEESSGAPLVAGMKASINDVSTLRIVGAGDQTLVTLSKAESGWTVGERDGYEADIEKVREYLLRLADATLIEAKTATETLYAKLGVESVSSAEAKGMRVEVEGLKTPVKLIVGNYNSQGGGTFVRRNDEKQSWLAKGTLTPEKLASNWLQKALADIPSSRIQRVETDVTGKLLVVHKTNPMEANFVVDGVPKGRELNSAFEGNGMASVLSGLRFEDVRKAGADEVTAANATVKTRFQTFDGVIITAMSQVQGDKTWVGFSAMLDPVIAEANILREQEQARVDFENAKKAHVEAVASQAAAEKKETVEVPAPPSEPLAVSDPAKDKAERMQKLEKEVSDFNARVRGWLYVLPPYTYANMSRKIEDLLKTESPEA
jgi:hypothetical protein